MTSHGVELGEKPTEADAGWMCGCGAEEGPSPAPPPRGPEDRPVALAPCDGGGPQGPFQSTRAQGRGPEGLWCPAGPSPKSPSVGLTLQMLLV